MEWGVNLETKPVLSHERLLKTTCRCFSMENLKFEEKNQGTYIICEKKIQSLDVSSDFIYICKAELGTLLLEIAQSLFALERTLILGAMALNKKKSEER